MAESLSLFGIVVGIALLLSGLGFGILAAGGALRGVEDGFGFFGKRAAQKVVPRPVPTV
jgi:F0F1-type ATP synthase membrane subunit c/vacuolar-type H+-ATPase subunit K